MVSAKERLKLKYLVPMYTFTLVLVATTSVNEKEAGHRFAWQVRGRNPLTCDAKNT